MACVGKDAADMVLSLFVFRLEHSLSASAAILRCSFIAASDTCPKACEPVAYNVDLHCLSVLTEKPVMKPSLAAAHRAIVSLVADAHLRSSVQPSGADQGAVQMLQQRLHVSAAGAAQQSKVLHQVTEVAGQMTATCWIAIK